jgi:DME family drug/metabolite transporter
MSTRSDGDGRRGVAAVLAAAVLFGTTGTAQELGPATSTPLVVGALRLAVGGLLLAVLGATRAGGWPVLWRAVRSPTGLVCGAGVALYNACFFFGVDLAGVAVGTLVTLGSAPFVTGLLSWRVDGVAPGRQWLAATSVSVCGFALLVAGGGTDAAGRSTLAGVVFALAAATGYALYTVVGRRLAVEAGPETYVGAAFGLGAALLSPVLLVALATGELAWVATASGAATALWLGVVPTAVAYTLFGRGLRRLRATVVSTITLAEPITATVLGVVVLGERLSWAGAAGLLLVVVGLLALAGALPSAPRLAFLRGRR